MNSVGRALGEEVAVLKVQGVILTVFTLFTLFLHMFRLRIRRHARAKHRKESPRRLERPQASLWPRNRVQKWGSMNGDVKKKHFSFRKERSVFLTSSSRPR